MDEYEEETLNIKEVFYNSKNSIISLIQQNSVSFYDLNSLKKFSENENIQKKSSLFQNIKICFPLDNTNLLIIVGNKDNKDFPSNKITFYDLEKMKVIGDIEILENELDIIYNVFVILQYLIVVTNGKILLFELIKGKLLKIFYDVCIGINDEKADNKAKKIIKKLNTSDDLINSNDNLDINNINSISNSTVNINTIINSNINNNNDNIITSSSKINENIQTKENNPSKGKISIFYDTKLIIISYISKSNPSIIKINKIKESSSNHLKFSQRYISTNLNGVQYISSSQNCKYLAVANSAGDKINIYSLRTYKIKKFLSNVNGVINEMQFDDDCKYLAVLTNNKLTNIYGLIREDLTVTNKQLRKNRTIKPLKLNGLHGTKIYVTKIKTINKYEESDNENKNQNKDNESNNKGNYIRSESAQIKKGGLFKYISNKISPYKEPFAYFKDKTFFKNNRIVFLYFNKNKDIIIFDYKGKAVKIKFNKKKGGLATIIENNTLEID